MSDEAVLVAGLGNPGAEYAGTRHNAGFMLIDKFCEAFGISMMQSKFEGIFGSSRIGGRAVYFLKPQTFMNLSGRSVVSCMQFYHIPATSVMVVHDDLDLAVGDIRVKSGGGAGGHNGLKSIISLCGASDFSRLRLGIGRPVHGDVVNYVLGRIGDGEQGELFGAALNLGVEALKVYLTQGAQASMRFCNGLYRAKKKEEEKSGQS